MDNTVKKTYMLPDFETQQDAISLFLRLMELSQEPNRYVRCIDLDGSAIGFLNDVEITGSTLEIGYVIHPEEQGKGYMTSALKIAMEELKNLGFLELTAGAFEENIPSIRVMEKCGMKKLPNTEELSYRGKTHRCIYYHYMLK